MTDFDASTPADRVSLIAEAVRAHRRRDEGTVTIESEAGDPPVWVQFRDDLVNLDCTDEELDRLRSLLDEHPSFTVEELTQPEDVGGTNVRVRAYGDPERIARFVERCLLEVYDLPESTTVWVLSI